MCKLDLTTAYPQYYSAEPRPHLVDFPPAAYLCVNGQGRPGGHEFERMAAAVTALAYGVKHLAREEGRDFYMPKLESLWWGDGGADVLETPPERCNWKLLLRMPEFVSSPSVEAVRPEVVLRKQNSDILDVRFEHLEEGASMQMLHVGPPDSLPQAVSALRAALAERGFTPCGPLHCLYLSDRKKSSPQRRRIIVRYPVG